MNANLQQILTNLASWPISDGLFALALLVVGLAKFTNALQSLSSFGERFFPKKKAPLRMNSNAMIEFEKIRVNIRKCRPLENLPSLLKNMREFLIRNAILDNAELKTFYDKWLDSIPVVTGNSMCNFLTDEEITQLVKDLDGLQF